MNRNYLVFVFASIASLFGCVSLNSDLATDLTALSTSDREIAKTMAEMTSSRCTRYTYDQISGQPLSGNVGLHQATVVNKLFSSTNNGWFRADIVNQGAWDSVYYNRISGRFVCGEKLWATDVGSNEAVFVEVKNGQATTNTIPSTPATNKFPSTTATSSSNVVLRKGIRRPPEQAIADDEARARLREKNLSDGAQSAEQRLIELKSLLDKELITPTQYDQKRAEILNSL